MISPQKWDLLYVQIQQESYNSKNINKNYKLNFQNLHLIIIFIKFKLQIISMTTAHTQLKQLDLPEQVRNDNEKLVNLEHSLGELATELINKDIDTIKTQTDKINNFADGINSVTSKLKIFHSECSKTIADLQAQVNDLNGKIKVYQRDFKNNNKENEYKKQIEINEKKYLAQWEKRIQIAAKIETDILAKIYIEDRKSKANQVFKWLIVTIYGQPDTKFYWPNFKEQIFQRDEAKDFRQRLGKINASSAREQQKVKTEEFLKGFKEIIVCEELKKATKQIEEIRNVAEIFLNCYEISRTIKNLEAMIEKSRQESRQKDEQAMRWKARAEALQDRIKSNKEYESVLNKIETMLGGKVQNYIDYQAKAKEICQRLSQSGSLGSILIQTPDQTRENCECKIF